MWRRVVRDVGWILEFGSGLVDVWGFGRQLCWWFRKPGLQGVGRGGAGLGCSVVVGAVGVDVAVAVAAVGAWFVVFVTYFDVEIGFIFILFRCGRLSGMVLVVYVRSGPK